MEEYYSLKYNYNIAYGESFLTIILSIYVPIALWKKRSALNLTMSFSVFQSVASQLSNLHLKFETPPT